MVATSMKRARSVVSLSMLLLWCSPVASIPITELVRSSPPSCVNALHAACIPWGRFPTTINACKSCSGTHQHNLQIGKCSATDIAWWCAEAVANGTKAAAPAPPVPPAPPHSDPAAERAAAEAFHAANLIVPSGSTAVAFDSDRDMLFSGTVCQGGTYDHDDSGPCKSDYGAPIMVWDVASQKHLANLTGHNATVTALAYDSARQLLFSASDEAADGECCGAVLMWDTASTPPKKLGELAGDAKFETCNPRSNGAPQIGIATLEYDSSRQLIFATCANSVLQFNVGFNPAQQLPSFQVGDEFDKSAVIANLAYDTDKQWLFSSMKYQKGYSSTHFSNHIYRWSTDTASLGDESLMHQLDPLSGHVGGITSLAYDTAGHRLFSGSGSNELFVWDTLRNATISVSSVLAASSDDDDIIGGGSSASSIDFLLYAGGTLMASSDRGQTVLFDTMQTPPVALRTIAIVSTSLRLQSVGFDAAKNRCVATESQY